MKAIKAAAVQAASVYLDLDASITKAAALASEAARNGAKLVAFPETWLPGYPFFVWLAAPAEGMRFIPQYHANSMELQSSEMKRLQKIAAANEITLVMGYSEREGGSRYMSQAIIGERGEILLNRRKLKPTHVERTVFGEGDGCDLRVINAAFGRLGALNCWEHMQPLLKMAMYSQFEEVHVAAWPALCLYREMAYALGPEVNNGASRQYAVEGSAYVLAPSAIINQEVFDLLADTPEKAALPCHGAHPNRSFVAGSDNGRLRSKTDDQVPSRPLQKAQPRVIEPSAPNGGDRCMLMHAVCMLRSLAGPLFLHVQAFQLAAWGFPTYLTAMLPSEAR